MEWEGNFSLYLCLLIWWEFVITCINYFFYWEIHLKSLSGRLRDSSVQAPWICSTVAGQCWKWSPHCGRLASPHSPHSTNTTHTLLCLCLWTQSVSLPKQGLPPVIGKDSEEPLPRHSWMGKWGPSCPATHGRRKHKPLKARKVFSLLPLPSRETGALSLPLCWPHKQRGLRPTNLQAIAQTSFFQRCCPGLPFQRYDSTLFKSSNYYFIYIYNNSTII